MIGRILVATSNLGKLVEYGRMMEEGIEVIGSTDFPDMPVPDEDGRTFAENAIKKAISAAEYSGMLTLADDSGLVVDALGGEPGVRTARYGEGQAFDDEQRYMLVLKKLTGVDPPQRTARFVCATALAGPGGLIAVTEGTCEGSISFGPRGDNGFGYDPIFIPQGYACSFAELSDDEKDLISHRRKALIEMLPFVEAAFQK